MNKNYQKQLETFWHNACYAMCISFINTDPVMRDNLYYMVMNVFQGWSNKLIDDDCYVSKPHKFSNMCSGEDRYKDVEKVPLEKLEDFPDVGEYAVEWKCPTGGSHFTVETKETIMTDEPLFDPSYLSKSRAGKQFISYRRFIPYKK